MTALYRAAPAIADEREEDWVDVAIVSRLANGDCICREIGRVFNGVFIATAAQVAWHITPERT